MKRTIISLLCCMVFSLLCCGTAQATTEPNMQIIKDAQVLSVKQSLLGKVNKQMDILASKGLEVDVDNTFSICLNKVNNTNFIFMPIKDSNFVMKVYTQTTITGNIAQVVDVITRDQALQIVSMYEKAGGLQ